MPLGAQSGCCAVGPFDGANRVPLFGLEAEEWAEDADAAHDLVADPAAERRDGDEHRGFEPDRPAELGVGGGDDEEIGSR